MAVQLLNYAKYRHFWRPEAVPSDPESGKVRLGFFNPWDKTPLGNILEFWTRPPKGWRRVYDKSGLTTITKKAEEVDMAPLTSR